MEHLKAIAIKGVMTLAALWLILTLGFGVPFWAVLVMTVVLGVVSYPVGDLKIYPYTSNMIASTADVGIAFLIIWGIGTSMASDAITGWPWAAFTAAIVLGVGEYFFHYYIARKPLGGNKKLQVAYNE